MGNTFRRSWQLFKASFQITLKNRKLLWFPILSLFFTAVIALGFLVPVAVPMALHPTGYKLSQAEHWEALGNYYFKDLNDSKTAAASAGSRQAGHSSSKDVKIVPRSPLMTAYLAVVYFASMFLATFFNVAFYNEIIEVLNSRGVSLRRGIGVAFKRIPAILGWTMLAGIVGWIIRSLEERVPFMGRVILALVGTAWSVAAVFVVPVIIQDATQSNPLKLLRNSAETLKRAWGEGLVGYAGFSAASTMIFLGSLVPLIGFCGLAIYFNSVAVAMSAIGLWVVALFALSYISGVASQVYRCVLFIYATEGVVPEPYDQELLQAAWKMKKN